MRDPLSRQQVEAMAAKVAPLVVFAFGLGLAVGALFGALAVALAWGWAA